MEKQKVLKTVRDFIKFFEGISEDRWLKYQLYDLSKPDCHCANGHLGVTNPYYVNQYTKNSMNLARLTEDESMSYSERIALINNGSEGYHTLGNNPKERVLNYLYTLEQLNELSRSK